MHINHRWVVLPDSSVNKREPFLLPLQPPASCGLKLHSSQPLLLSVCKGGVKRAQSKETTGGVQVCRTKEADGSYRSRSSSRRRRMMIPNGMHDCWNTLHSFLDELHETIGDIFAEGAVPVWSVTCEPDRSLDRRLYSLAADPGVWTFTFIFQQTSNWSNWDCDGVERTVCGRLPRSLHGGAAVDRGENESLWTI